MASCNESALDTNCTCSSKFGPGVNTKLYDYETQEYLCCGKVGYDLHTAVLNNNNSLLEAAAAMDDPRCTDWWLGSLDPTYQAAVAGAGPSTSKVTALTHLATLSEAFPSAEIDGKTGEYKCDGKVSGLSNLATVPRYLAYRNPDAGPNYVESVVCVPYDATAPTTPYNNVIPELFSKNEDFAIFKINGCPNAGGTSCAPAGGLATAGLGKLEFSSKLYTGGSYPNHGNSQCNIDYNIMWLLIVIFVSFFLVLLFVGLYYAFRSPEPDFYPPYNSKVPSQAIMGYPKPATENYSVPVMSNQSLRANIAPTVPFVSQNSGYSVAQPIPYTGSNYLQANSAAITNTLAAEYR